MLLNILFYVLALTCLHRLGGHSAHLFIVLSVPLVKWILPGESLIPVLLLLGVLLLISNCSYGLVLTQIQRLPIALSLIMVIVKDLKALLVEQDNLSLWSHLALVLCLALLPALVFLGDFLSINIFILFLSDSLLLLCLPAL